MAEGAALCAICGKRKPKRFCPGVGSDICPICCGTEREVTVNCPLECVYLQEARRRETLPSVNPREFPNADIKVEEPFLRRNESLLIILSVSIGGYALNDGNRVVDSDVREALAALVQTYRTLQSGLYYESRPANPLARAVVEGVQQDLTNLRKRAAENGQSIRDSDVLGVLVFLQRMSIQHDNGRPKGRAFIDFLRNFFRPGAPGSSTQPDDSPGDTGTGSNLIITP